MGKAGSLVKKFHSLARAGPSRHSPPAELGGSLREYRIGLVIGTRPEAIKLAPVAHALDCRGVAPTLYLTGQHPGLEPADHGLQGYLATPLGQPGLADPHEHAERVAQMLKRVWGGRPPTLAMVQGDTSSALGGALAATALGVPLAHVEAGLRTHDRRLPWPEEEFRVEIDRVADLLFAPTATSAANLRDEQCPGEIHVTGNSGIDALLAELGRAGRKRRRARRGNRPPALLVTCHRRETWGAGFAAIAAALIDLARDEGARIDVVLHPNPRVSEAMYELLHDQPGIRLLPPLSHSAMIDAMLGCDLLLSDSGGLQEEAPALGVPLLVLRDKSDRPEGLDQAGSRLVGTGRDSILTAVRDFTGPNSALALTRPAFPFGDGQAAPRIAAIALDWLDRRTGDASLSRAG